MKKTKKGFTIVELVIVIAVIGVLAAVLIPTFTTVIRKAKLSKAEQTAYNISLNLASDAAFDGVSYYTADSVIAKATEYGYNLVSELDKYSYWYDASVNKVVYSKTSDTVGTDDLLATVAYADETEFTATVRSIAGVPSLYYIEQSDNPITKAINTIENLVVESGFDSHSMTGVFNASVSKLGDKIKNHLNNFSPENTAYICDSGIFTAGSGTQVQNAVVCAGTTAIPKVKEARSLTIVNKIVIPASVVLIEDNAFDGITATVEINSKIGLDVTKLGGSVVVENKSSAKAAAVVALSDGDYSLNYGYQKEASDIAGITYTSLANFDNGLNCYSPLVTLGNLSDYSDDAAVVDSLVCEYMVPALSLVNNQAVYFGDIEKLSVRSHPVDGGIEYVLVAVDKDFNVYKLSNVGSLNRAKISYDRNNEASENVIVEFGRDAIAFTNLSGIKYVLTYQTGYSEITAGSTISGDIYYNDSGISSWNSDTCTFTSGAVAASNRAVLDLSGKTVSHNGEVKQCNVANVLSVTVYTADDTAILTQYFDSRSTNTGSVTITLNNNIAGSIEEETIVTTVESVVSLNHSYFNDATSGYRLLSWNTMPDGSGTGYNISGASFYNDITLYAVTERYNFNIIMSMYYPTDSLTGQNEERVTLTAQLGDTIVISDGGNKITVGDRVYNVNFGTAVSELERYGFTFNRWDCSSFFNTYGKVNYLLSSTLDCAIPVDETFASKVSTSLDNPGTLYIFGCGTANVVLYKKDGTVFKTFANHTFYLRFGKAVTLPSGCTRWYSNAEGTGEYISSIAKTTMVTRNAYYAQ